METFQNIRHEKKKDDLRAFRKNPGLRIMLVAKLVLGDKMENFKNPEGNVSY